MKLRLLLLSFLFSFNALAQNKLSKSKQASDATFVYKITDDEVSSILDKKKTYDSFYHTLISKDYYKDYRKADLPYGNYLLVNASGNFLGASLKSENNVSLQFINNQHDFQFFILDVKGNLVNNALVQIDGKKSIRYDAKAKLYRGHYAKVKGVTKEKGIIKVVYNGISNFFEYDVDDNNRENEDREDWSFFKKTAYSTPIKYFWQPFKAVFKKKRSNKPLFAGYMVYSKPKYKPLDTVKLKAFVIQAKGGNIASRPANVVLDNGNTKKILATINPYKNGGYEYSFVLADSLNLQLDRNYRISLIEKNNKTKKAFNISESFSLEDYELKALNFSIRTDKVEQTPDSLITVYLKAIDENELAVPDGRAEITLTTNYVDYYTDKKVFVPDTLWKKNITLEPVGETKLVLPANIFPKASLKFHLEAKFLNSNNEMQMASKDLRYTDAIKKNKSANQAKINSELRKDSLVVTYLVNNKSETHSAKLMSYTKNDVLLDSQKVVLPYIGKIDYRADYYEIESEKINHTVSLNDFEADLQINAIQNKDSLRVLVINDHKVPFWYTIFADKKVFLRGYTNQLDTLIKNDSKKASHIRINYFWDGDEETKEISAFYNPYQLNLKLIAPDVVYPGQKVNMLVQVTDINHKPVPETDITAQAFTAKFTDVKQIWLPYLGRKYAVHKLNNIKVEADEAYESTSTKLDQLTWLKWSKSLGLDSIEYYRFTHPTPIYNVIESTNDTTTQVAPFVILDGAILPAGIVYIDNLPVFFGQSQQLQRYSFVVKPGLHDFKIRTADKLVTVKNYNITANKKTIFSILADTTNKVVTVNKPTRLNADESQALDDYMIRVSNNFSLHKTTIDGAVTDTRLLINPNNRTENPLLIGPIKENNLVFDNEKWHQNFAKETGYTYTFEPGLIKQKSNATKYAFDTKLNEYSSNGNTNFANEYALKKYEIDKIWLDFMDLRSRTTQLFYNASYIGLKETGKLSYDIDTAFTNHIPYIKNIIAYKPNQANYLRIYKGDINTDVLEGGRYKILFLLKDNSYFIADDITVKPYGANYYRWSNFKINNTDAFSVKLDSIIKSTTKTGSYNGDSGTDITEETKTFFNSFMFDKKELKNSMQGRILSNDDGKPLANVLVQVVGLDVFATSDIKGFFNLKTPEKGKVKIVSKDYFKQTIDIVKGSIGDIKLKPFIYKKRKVEEEEELVQSKHSVAYSTASVSSRDLSYAMQGSSSGLELQEVSLVSIRGATTLPSNQKPLIIFDGLPFDGDLNSIDKANVKDITILKDASATAIYGSRGANGVIIIKSRNGNSGINLASEPVAQQQTMRTNFKDEGFWQPKLTTDENGTANFTVKFPDDITKWTTRVLAMNGNKQTGSTESTIKSFKSLSANFVSPLFALNGDSINVIGKLMNYTPLEETVVRKFLYNGKELKNTILKFKNSHIDTVGISVTSKDSLNFEYTLKQDNGYFDGELRKIPVFEAGVKETKGYFSALLRDTSSTYNFDKNLGKITLKAEASIFPTLLDEMTKLRNYEYLCNEQLASKLKSLLLEKKTRAYLNDKFTHEKDILFILKRLQQNKKTQGTWGWWQDSNEEMWISLHVVEALLLAEKQGYKVDLDKAVLYHYLENKLSDQQGYNDIKTIKLLHLLNDKYDIKNWVLAFERKELEKEQKRDTNISPELLALKQRETYVPIYEQFELMELKQIAGLKIDLKGLLRLKKQTMFGGIYWGEENIHFWDNSIQNTLLAYKILESAGGYENELEKISLYFLEQRKDGQWRNTYEASLILETILPELIKGNKKTEPASIKINEQTVTKFPFEKTIENPVDLKVAKAGKMAVYFTAYQQFQNANPLKVDKDFKVNTVLLQDNAITTKLKAGTLAKIKVEVEVKADADYVMIEIPIPAGCSYENKVQNFWGIETHREYFKNKTSIFCTKLKQGKYTFEIDLMPRYSGTYILNPSKAEMMYFPVFYGREGMKKVVIN